MSEARTSNYTGIRVRKTIAADKHKKRIFDVVNQLNEEELEKVSEMLKISQAMEGKGDILTEADGEEFARQAEPEANDEEPADDQEEADLIEEIDLNNRRAIIDDQATSVSRQVSQSAHSAINSL